MLTAHLTWENLMQLEPRLRDIEQRARSVDRDDWHAWSVLKRSFSALVGYWALPDADPILRTSEVYELTVDHLRDIIENKRLVELNVNSAFTIQDYKAVTPRWRTIIPEYVKDYVPLNQFM